MNEKEIKKIIINKTIEKEGGYVNDKDDSGGETKYGITLTVSKKYKKDIKKLTIDDAIGIYEKEYWDKLNLDTILKIAGVDIAEILFNIGVNLGINKAGNFLQETLIALNYKVSNETLNLDNIIGNKTINKLKEIVAYKTRNKLLIRTMLISNQINFYKDLSIRRPKDKKFLAGWILRVLDQTGS